MMRLLILCALLGCSPSYTSHGSHKTYTTHSSKPEILLAQAASNSAPANPAEKLENLDQLPTLELKGATFHVQGIDLDATRLWVTSVDSKSDKGYLHEFDLKTGELIREIEVQEGNKIHPGGIATDETSIWIPVAEYSRKSSAVIQRRDKKTLDLISKFEVADHIGCVAVDEDRVIGGNWDSLELYYWNRRGELIGKKSNPTGNRFQDMKIVDGKLVGSGGIEKGVGAIDWLDPQTLAPIRRVIGGRTGRGASYMGEGMTLRGGIIYLLPEDGHSRLFAFGLE